MRLFWISWWALNPMTNFLKRDRSGKYSAKRRKRREVGGRDWSDGATKKGLPAHTLSWKRQKSLP